MPSEVPIQISLPGVPSSAPVIGYEMVLKGVAGRVQHVLARKKQVILYGPPGTGKTYWARRTARDLAAYKKFGRLFAELDSSQKTLRFGIPFPSSSC